MSNFNLYKQTFEYKKKMFVAKQQRLQFDTEYARNIAKQSSEFAQKVKEKRLQQIANWAKKNLDILAKPFYNLNTTHQNSHTNRNPGIKLIAA